MNKDNTVAQAGGFIIQLMPFTSDEVIEQLEQNIAAIPSVTMMLADGKTPEEILQTVLDGFEVTVHETMPTQFFCDCSSQRVERSLCSLGDEDVADIIADGKPIEIKCQFCNKAYHYTVEQLVALRKNS